MNSPRKITTGLMLALVGALLAGNAGCGMKDFKPSKMFSLDNAWPFDGDDLDEGTPIRVVGAWTDTVLTKQGEIPQRGFGGRLAFYDGESEKAVLVEGELVVYAFDESGRDPTDNKPTRRYVFPADQMALRMSETDLGATYSFWLPWDEAGGPQSEVSLICRFQPKKGAVVVSEQTKHRLPGSLPVAGADAKQQAPVLPEGVPSRPARATLESLQTHRPSGNGGAQLANYEAPIVEPQQISPAMAAAAIEPARQMTVTSISLPDNFQLRDLAAAAQQTTPAVSAVGQPLQPVQQAPVVQSQQPIAVPQPGMIPAQPQMMNGAYAPPQQPAAPQQQQQYSPAAAMQPGQPTLSMPRVYAPPVNVFGGAPYAAAQVTGPQPLPAQTTPQVMQHQPGQQMPVATPMQTTVSYPTQAMRR